MVYTAMFISSIPPPGATDRRGTPDVLVTVESAALRVPFVLHDVFCLPVALTLILIDLTGPQTYCAAQETLRTY